MMLLEARQIEVRRGGAPIIAGASLAAPGGAFIALCGPNGAGKSTLLRALAGLEALAAGEVRIGGMAFGDLSTAKRARTLSYLPQTRDVAWAMTAEAIVALGRLAYGDPHRLGPPDRAAVERAIAATDADLFRHRTMPTLSGGEQARVHLARALAAETPILLADEPTAALDPRHADAIMRALREKAAVGGLVIAALHDLRLAARWATRTVLMKAGRIVADGDPATALTPSAIADVFDLPAADF